MKVSAAITVLSGNWRVEFEQPDVGEFVVVDLFRDDERIAEHDVRWHNRSNVGSYLGNYSLSGAARSLVGTPLYMLDAMVRKQLGLGDDDG